ncbi:hypothetical protein [Nocardioides sp. BYT-33-1]|uniref:hypothetical protein n=1 Tax=Nocardioides sp. BYT-33-1 TaxID=3416952 RepID=UPI003F533FD5
MVTTPGVGGYLVAWLVSVLAFTLGLLPWLHMPRAEGPGWSETIVTLYAVGIFSIPFACIGVPLVHFACREIRSQWVHVLCAGVVGWLSLVVPGILFGADPSVGDSRTGPPDELFVGALILGGSTALGRLAVVPLVWLRRAARDSAGSPARC